MLQGWLIVLEITETEKDGKRETKLGFVLV